MAEAKGAAIGIDLGTMNCCVGVFKNGKVEIIPDDLGERTTPSYVEFTEDEIVVGAGAQRGARFLNNTVFGIKRLFGRNFTDGSFRDDLKYKYAYWPFKVINDNGRPKIQIKLPGETKNYHPEEITSMILRKMKSTAEAYLGEPVTTAVISVPANFNSAQREATKDAAAIAQLDVVRLISDPSAAALAYGFENKERGERNMLVFDLGAGTFDVSILTTEDNIFEVKSISGDTHFGGEDFDNRMAAYFADEFFRKYDKDLTGDKKAVHRLKTACERAKKTLSTATVTTIEIQALYEGIDFSSSITRECFEELNAEQFQRTLDLVKEALDNAPLTKYQIHDIVLVGGSTRIPKIRNLLQDFFGEIPLSNTINADEAVAYGAAIKAQTLKNNSDDAFTNSFMVLEAIPMSLGVAIILENDCDVQEIVKRNFTIPTKNTKAISITQFHNNPHECFWVYEGEHLLAKFDEFPIVPVGKAEISIIIDADCTIENIHLYLENHPASDYKCIVINHNKYRLSQDEIDLMINESKKYYEVRNRIKKSKMVAINCLESFCIDSQAEISKDEVRYNMRQSDRMFIAKKCAETIDSLQSYQANLNVEEIKTKHIELKRAFDLIITMAKASAKMNDLYRKILNVDRGASEDEILKGYRQATLKYLPSNFQGNSDVASWWSDMISEAKKTLTCLDQRETT